MAKSLRFRTILRLPLATVIFVAGWCLYIVGSYKTKSKAVLKPIKQATDGIEFTLWPTKEQEVPIIKK
jgi:hypothetical protein